MFGSAFLKKKSIRSKMRRENLAQRVKKRGCSSAGVKDGGRGSAKKEPKIDLNFEREAARKDFTVALSCAAGKKDSLRKLRHLEPARRGAHSTGTDPKYLTGPTTSDPKSLVL